MDAELVQAGERLVLRSEPAWLEELLVEGADGAWQPVSGRPVDVEVVVERRTTAFGVEGWEPLTRGAHRHGNRCVVVGACGSGLDLLVEAGPPEALPGTSPRVRITARFRPASRERLAAFVLRSRAVLLLRAVLLQYPALWLAGTRGRVPLHASAVTVDGGVVLLAGPGGVGRTSLVLDAVRQGSEATSDNLAVTDGRQVLGLVEPVRSAASHGRRMPHGRREGHLDGRVPILLPDRIVVLRRGTGPDPVTTVLRPADAARVLTAATYMAGELRRYWPLAATLSLGTGLGPCHPAVAEAATEVARRLPATELALALHPGPGPSALLAAQPVDHGRVA